MFLQSLCLAAHERGTRTVGKPRTSLVMATHAHIGLATCMQEAWHVYHATVRRQLRIPDDQVSQCTTVVMQVGYVCCDHERVMEARLTPWAQIIWCGVSLGVADPSAPVNSLRSLREDVDDFARFEGFASDVKSKL